MNKVVLFGAGYQLKSFLNYFIFNIQMKDTEIVAICDNDEHKQGKYVYGYKIVSPNCLSSLMYDEIIITSQKIDDIKNQLMIQMNLKTRIWTIQEYKIYKTIEYNLYINDKRNEQQKLLEEDIFDENSLVVYTALLGDYDKLREPEQVRSNIKYVCFTDNCKIQSRIWDVQYISHEGDLRQSVKEYKMLPHKYFPNYKTSIWVDASFTIKEDIVELMKRYQKCAPILFIPHYERVCAYAEAAACMDSNLDDNNLILKQINKYYNEGFPVNQGLMCGGFMVRQHNNARVQRIMEEWYEEITNYSKRDQISLPYLLWKSGMNYDFCDFYCQSNYWLENNSHRLIREG